MLIKNILIESGILQPRPYYLTDGPATIVELDLRKRWPSLPWLLDSLRRYVLRHVTAIIGGPAGSCISSTRGLRHGVLSW
jgi:hypothetical protein